MKMFALESGENNTPKDKLKISRAQRDIDAVHWLQVADLISQVICQLSADVAQDHNPRYHDGLHLTNHICNVRRNRPYTVFVCVGFSGMTAGDCFWGTRTRSRMYKYWVTQRVLGVDRAKNTNSLYWKFKQEKQGTVIISSCFCIGTGTNSIQLQLKMDLVRTIIDPARRSLRLIWIHPMDQEERTEAKE